MSFTVVFFAADPEKLREKLISDPDLVDEVTARAGVAPEQAGEFCARVSAARSLSWPVPGDELSFDAFFWVLDYAAERINVARLQDVRYSSLVDEIPLLAEMTADPGSLPLPDVRGLECEMGYLPPEKLREIAERGPPTAMNPLLDVGQELIEVFESLADDNLGLYTIIEGAKITRAVR